MNTFRAALAGPGPATVAYRLKRLRRNLSIIASQQAHASSQTLPTRSAKSAYELLRQTDSQPRLPRAEDKDSASANSVASQTATTPGSTIPTSARVSVRAGRTRQTYLDASAELRTGCQTRQTKSLMRDAGHYDGVLFRSIVTADGPRDMPFDPRRGAVAPERNSTAGYRNSSKAEPRKAVQTQSGTTDTDNPLPGPGRKAASKRQKKPRSTASAPRNSEEPSPSRKEGGNPSAATMHAESVTDTPPPRTTTVVIESPSHPVKPVARGKKKRKTRIAAQEAKDSDAEPVMAGKRPDAAAKTIHARHDTPAAVASVAVAWDENAVMLPPPIKAVDSAGVASETLKCIEAGDLDGALAAWSVIVDSQAESSVPKHVHEILSEELVKVISGTSQFRLHAFYFKDPAGFDIMRHMAIEAAAYDKWEGLYEFLLELLAAGHPALASTIWKQFMKRAREVQGRNEEDLNSPIRAHRVAARLQGDGMLPLMLVQVAALTMLDAFDHTAVMSFFCTSAGVRGDLIKWTELRAISHRLGGAWNPRNSDLFKRYRENIDVLTLCVMCYHPMALKARIDTLASAKDGRGVKLLYDRIMRASLGPRRLIVPVTGDRLHYDVVPLPPSIWKAFLAAFARLQWSDAMTRMLDVELPERYSRTPTHMLGFAMEQMSKSAAMTAQERQDARAGVDELWRRIGERGAHNEPVMLRFRLVTLYQLHDVKGLFEVYTQAKAELRKRNDTSGDSFLDPVLFSYLCYTNHFVEALAMLKNHKPYTDGGTAAFHAFDAFLKHALSNGMAYSSRRRLLLKILEIKPPAIQFRGQAWGRILSFLLEGGRDVEASIADVAAKRGRHPGTTFWGPFLKRLLYSHNGVGQEHLKAAVLLLEQYVSPDCAASGNSFRLYSTWRMVTTVLAKASYISAAERHALLERAIAAWPKEEQHAYQLPNVILEIVRASLSRSTSDGVPEALHWWSQLKPGQARTHDYHWLVEGLVKHDYPQIAGDIVDTLKPGAKTQAIVEHAHSLGVKTSATHGDVEPQGETRESLEDREERLDSDIEVAAEESEDAEAEDDQEAQVDEF